MSIDFSRYRGQRFPNCQIEEYTFVYKDRYKMHLIDTPGFDDTQRKDIDVLKEISSVSMNLIS